MKKAAKIFIWIGMIYTFYLIFPIIVGVLALKKLNNYTNKEDLTTMGILTLFFCSTLGGVFMLCINDEKLNNSSDSNIVEYKNTIVTNETQLNPQTKTKVNILNKVLIYVLIFISLFAFTYSLIPFCLYLGYSMEYLCLFFSIGIVLIVSALSIMTFMKKENIVASSILFAILFGLSAALIVFSILGWMESHTVTGVLNYGYYDYDYDIAWQYWIVFANACLLTIISTFKLIFDLIIYNKTKPQKRIKEKVVTTQFEIELNKINEMFENKLVTQEEYEQMRKSVINKYYK